MRQRKRPPLPEERKGLEIKRKNFKLIKEVLLAFGRKGNKAVTAGPKALLHNVRRAFGVEKKLENEEHRRIATIELTEKIDVAGNGHGTHKTETTHWYVDKRRKKGTIADRRRK